MVDRVGARSITLKKNVDGNIVIDNKSLFRTIGRNEDRKERRSKWI